MDNNHLLQVKDLKMYYVVENGFVKAVDDVSFYLDAGETLGVVGESGCGKTSLGLTLLRVLPTNGRIMGGQILYRGTDVIALNNEEFNKIRWTNISMIFQAAMNSLDPVYKVGDQLIEVLKVHDKDILKEDAERRIKEVFEIVELSPSHMNSYPHELSGGMKQRAIIAMSLLFNPKIVIADEATTALDVVVQDQILQKIREIQQDFKLSVILITHNVSVIAENSDRVAVMYGGNIVESGKTVEVLEDARHPYAFALFRSVANVRGPVTKLYSLEGTTPNLLNPPSGCRFEQRCPLRRKICKEQTPNDTRDTYGHWHKCHFLFNRSDFSCDA